MYVVQEYLKNLAVVVVVGIGGVSPPPPPPLPSPALPCPLVETVPKFIRVH